MPERGQERRLQFFALTRNLRGLAFIKHLDTLDGDGHKPRQSVQCPSFYRTAGHRQDTDRPCPHMQGDQVYGVLAVMNYAVSAVAG